MEDYLPNCYIVEDYLTNPYQLSADTVSRVRSQSVSTKMGRLNTKQLSLNCQLRRPQSSDRFTSSTASSMSSPASGTSSPASRMSSPTSSISSPNSIKLVSSLVSSSSIASGIIQTNVNKRIEFLRSKTTSFSSHASSSLSLATSTPSPSPPHTESSDQFWNKYRRKSTRPSLWKIVKQVLKN